MKKWVNLLLSTALLSGALTPVMVLENHKTAYAATEVEKDKFADMLLKIYGSMNASEKDAVNVARTKLDAITDAEWQDIIGPAVIAKVDNKLEPGKAIHIVRELAAVALSTDTNFESSIKAFKTKYADDFDTLFGKDLTVDVMFEFVNDFLKKLGQVTVAELKNGTSMSDLVKQKLHATANDAKYAHVDNVLYNNLGIGIDGVLAIKDRLDVKIDSHNDARDALISGLLKSGYLYAQTPGGNFPTPGGDTPGTPSIPVGDKVVVTPNVTVTIERGTNGVSVSVVKLNENDLLTKLGSGNKASAIVVPVNAQNGQAKVVLSANLLSQVADKNGNSSVITQVGGTSYELPVSLVNKTQLSKALGLPEADLANADVSIVISEDASGAAPKAGNVVSKVFSFSIQVTAGGNTTELNNFGQTFINRSFDLDSTVDGKKSVGVVVNADGSVAPVPTEFVTVGGKKVAVLKRNSNSTYAVVSNDVTFSDITGSWAAEDIKLLANKLIVSGYSDGTFKPSGDVTRAEFVTLLVRSLGLDKAAGESKFHDVAAGDWFAGYLNAAAKTGLVNGYEDGTFRGNDKITRQDAVVLLNRTVDFLKLRGDLADQDALKSVQAFLDTADVSDYAKQAVGVATALKIVNGNGDGTFNPQGNTNRAESVIMIEKLLKKAKFLSE